MYVAPDIESGTGITGRLRDLPGRVLVVTMAIPWAMLRRQTDWEPAHLHFVEDMDLATVERLDRVLPACDVVVGIGGGSCCDTAKYLAWKRGCRMILVPTIVSVDAPLTNMVAVRVDKAVKYVGDIFPRELLIDYALIRQAPPELNRAGAADIASIHTALYDWELAHKACGEHYDAGVANAARACLDALDRNAAEVHDVTPRGIDTIVDLYRREVEFCAHLHSSRPEEGSEHLVAYNLEQITRRHFLHGDLVALGLFLMTRLQDNGHEWMVGLMDRLGLRYRVPDVLPEEIGQCLRTLGAFVEKENMFYSVVNERAITGAFVAEAVRALYPAV